MLNMNALELSRAIKDKKINVTEAVEAYLDSIEKKDGEFNSFITVTKEYALERAAMVQARLDKGEDISPLAGVPIAVKDNISTEGILTTCASKMLEDYVPVFNATVVDKLEQAGMIILGKTNMDELAMGGTGETGAFGTIRNPWDTSRTAGGSSGGSAAAVAGGIAPLALGTDTGGSVRQPCAFNGLTGIKPTYGSVSRHGLFAYGSSLDQIGVMGLDIDDCAALLSVISGPCEKDSTCVIEKSFEFVPSQSNKMDGVKIGLPRNFFDDVMIDTDVKQAILAAAKEFEAAGAQVEEFDMPLIDYIVPMYFSIAYAEASSNSARFDGLKYGHRSKGATSLSDVYNMTRNEGFGFEVKKRLLTGSMVLSADFYEEYYSKALKARRLLKDAYNQLFEKYDMILSPISPMTPFKLGESTNNVSRLYTGSLYVVPVNLAGLPVVALPCGFGENKMPIAFQLIGNAFTDPELIKAAQIYQNRTTHHTKRPGGVKA